MNSPDPTVPIRPFILWTQRRTGGTTLMRLLETASGLTAWPDEAFNADRELGGATTAFEETAAVAPLRAAIEAMLLQRRPLKHSIETVPWALSRELLRLSTAQAWRHLVLLRRNEVERQLSLSLALQTDIWSPEAAETGYAALRAQAALPPLDLLALRRRLNSEAAVFGRFMRCLLQDEIIHRVVFTEDLFAGSLPRRRAHFEAALSWLGLPRAALAEAQVDAALLGRDQNSRAAFDLLPNLAEAVAMAEHYC